MVALLVLGCQPAPGTEAIETAVERYFAARGYAVVRLSVGEMRQNPVREREYMGPLTYVIGVPHLTLERVSPPAVAEDASRANLSFSDVTFKLQATGNTERSATQWVVSQVAGVDIR
jgi:hypothetical protein